MAYTTGPLQEYAKKTSDILHFNLWPPVDWTIVWYATNEEEGEELADQGVIIAIIIQFLPQHVGLYDRCAKSSGEGAERGGGGKRVGLQQVPFE